jgi:ABC-type thiamine transport system ATPase subunit
MRMAGITLAMAEAKLSAWLDAEEKLTLGQSVSVEGRSLTRADLEHVGQRVAYWDRYCKRLGNRRSGLQRVVAARG